GSCSSQASGYSPVSWTSSPGAPAARPTPPSRLGDPTAHSDRCRPSQYLLSPRTSRRFTTAGAVASGSGTADHPVHGPFGDEHQLDPAVAEAVQGGRGRGAVVGRLDRALVVREIGRAW